MSKSNDDEIDYEDDYEDSNYSFDLDEKLHQFLASQGIPIDNVNLDDDDNNNNEDDDEDKFNDEEVEIIGSSSSINLKGKYLNNNNDNNDNNDNEDENNYNYNFDDSINQSIDQSMSEISMLMPSYTKINNILKERGYDPITFLQSDIRIDNKTISIYSLDVWAESILGAFNEMVERLYNHQNAIQSASMSMKKGVVSAAALKSRVEDLQQKLYESEKKEKKLSAKVIELEESRDLKVKKNRFDENDSKKIIKNLELQLSESERRVRQRDIEIERMREKLRMLSNKEKDIAAKHNSTLSSYKQFSVSKSKSPQSPDKSKRPTPSDIIEALEAQRTKLQLRILELEEQVQSMSKSLKELGYKKTPIPNSDEEDIDIENVENVSHTNSKVFLSKIEHLKSRQEELTSHYQNLKNQFDEQVDLNQKLQQEMKEYSDENENLKLELESRPTAKKLKQKELEIENLESKLHDLIMLRGETAEIEGWRKHLQTSERIKIDKRNHELGLWLIEALPKTVMKETLQSVCRELDVSEISELQPSLSKLKAAVRVIPRMENFITSICEFVFNNDVTTKNIISKPTIDDVIPIIKKWCSKSSECEDLQKFTKGKTTFSITIINSYI